MDNWNVISQSLSLEPFHGHRYHLTNLLNPLLKNNCHNICLVSIIKKSDKTKMKQSQIPRFTGPTWGPPGSCRPQMGPMLAPWTLLSGIVWRFWNSVQTSMMHNITESLHRTHCEHTLHTLYQYICVWYLEEITVFLHCLLGKSFKRGRSINLSFTGDWKNEWFACVWLANHFLIDYCIGKMPQFNSHFNHQGQWQMTKWRCMYCSGCQLILHQSKLGSCFGEPWN